MEFAYSAVVCRCTPTWSGETTPTTTGSPDIEDQNRILYPALVALRPMRGEEERIGENQEGVEEGVTGR